MVYDLLLLLLFWTPYLAQPGSNSGLDMNHSRLLITTGILKMTYKRKNRPF